MEVKITKDKCIGCGNCVALTNQEIFDFDDDGLAKVINTHIDNDKIEIVKEAINGCPTEAITEE